MRGLLLVVVVVVGAFSACATDEGDGESERTAFVSYCDDWARMICGIRADCECTSPETSAECEYAEFTRCSFRLADELSRPSVAFDAEAAEDCIRDIEDLSASCSIADLESAELPNCSDMFQGVLQLGATCYTFGSCAEGLACSDVDNTCQLRGGQGESCEHVPCQKGLYCTYEDGCQSPGGNGDFCVDGRPCSEGLYCDWNGTGSCIPFLSEGELCGQGFGGPCEEGTYCDWYETSSCVRHKNDGEECLDSEQCQRNSYCRAVEASVEGEHIYVCTPIDFCEFF